MVSANIDPYKSKNMIEYLTSLSWEEDELNKHPDLISINVTSDVRVDKKFLPEIREGINSGYVLDDGIFFNPIHGEFVAFLTLSGEGDYTQEELNYWKTWWN